MKKRLFWHEFMSQILWEKESFCEEDTENAGKELAKILKKGDFIALTGDLGAGKTAFVRGLCREFCPTARVSSPTYTVMRCYEGGVCTFYHFDMYRITSPEDLESVGFYDCDGVIAAEWSENIPYALPEDRYQVTICKKQENSRVITLLKHCKEKRK